MDATEFINERDRMCRYYSCRCSACPARIIGCASKYVHGDKEKSDRLIDLVKNWSDLHPIKTNRTKLQEMFPDCKITSYLIEGTNSPSLIVTPEVDGFWDDEYEESDY